MEKLRVSGIYDLTTLELLLKSNIKSLVFDLRPKSINFIQEKVLFELLKFIPITVQVSFHFSDAKDFEIKHFIEKCRTEYENLNFILEFSDNQAPSFYNSFNERYICHYNSSQDVDALTSSENFYGFYFDSSYFKNMFNFNNDLSEFSFLYERIKEEKKIIIFSYDQDEEVMKILNEFYEAEFINLTIDTNHENYYRNINLSFLTHDIMVTKANFNL